MGSCCSRNDLLTIMQLQPLNQLTTIKTCMMAFVDDDDDDDDDGDDDDAVACSTTYY